MIQIGGIQHKMSTLGDLKEAEALNPNATLAILVASGVVVPEPQEVVGYLAASPEVAAVLPDYWRSAFQAGGDESQLSLELYRDPEIEDDHLVIYIRQEHYRDDLMDRIDKVREALAGELSDNLSGWIHVTTDFGRPR
jgi:hypothetical protein